MINLKQETLKRMNALLAEKVMCFKWEGMKSFKEDSWIQGAGVGITEFPKEMKEE